MFSSFPNRFSGSSSTSAKKSKPQNRKLQIESLEARQMLSISPIGFPQYDDLYIQSNMAVDYNVMEPATIQFAASAAPLSDVGFEEIAKAAGSRAKMERIAVEQYGYTIDIEWHNPTGLDAYGLVCGNKALLVFRATEIGGGSFDLMDILSDANPLGVGYDQYNSAKGSISKPESILGWASQFSTVSVTGHSLGGALAQHFAADWTSTSIGGKIDTLMTFQSAGVSKDTAAKFRAASCTTNVHHIAAGDLVSLSGTFVSGASGRFEYLFYVDETNDDPNFFTAVHSEYLLSGFMCLPESPTIMASFNNDSFSYGNYAGILSRQNLMARCNEALEKWQDTQKNYGAKFFSNTFGQFSAQVMIDAVTVVEKALSSRSELEKLRTKIIPDIAKNLIVGGLVGGVGGVIVGAIASAIKYVPVGVTFWNILNMNVTVPDLPSLGTITNKTLITDSFTKTNIINSGLHTGSFTFTLASRGDTYSYIELTDANFNSNDDDYVNKNTWIEICDSDGNMKRRVTGEAPRIYLEGLDAGTYTVNWHADLKWVGTTVLGIVINPPGRETNKIPSGSWGTITNKTMYTQTFNKSNIFASGKNSGSFSFTLASKGDAKSYIELTDASLFNDDDDFVNDSTWLEIYDSTGKLVRGRTKGEAPCISLNGLAAGTYTVKWQVDLKWAGNTKVAIVTNPPFVPNLAVSNGGTLPPNPITKGNTFTVTTGTIQNTGNRLSGTYTITYYASTDATINTSDIKLGSFSMLNLEREKATTDTRAFSTANLNAGTYYIGWIITDVSGEVVTTNNTARTTTTLTIQNPADLVAPNGGTHPGSIAAGSTFSVTTGTIKNNGDLASSNYTVAFYASTSTSFPSGTYLGSVNMGSLAAGASTTATLNNINTQLPTGSYYIGWVISGDNGENVGYNPTRLTVTTVPSNWGTITDTTTYTERFKKNTIFDSGRNSGSFTFTLADKGDANSYIELTDAKFNNNDDDFVNDSTWLEIYNSAGQLILGRKTGEAPRISLEGLAAGTYTVKWQVDLKWAGTTDVAIIINPPGHPTTTSGIPSGSWGTITNTTIYTQSFNKSNIFASGKHSGSFSFTLEDKGDANSYIELTDAKFNNNDDDFVNDSTWLEIYNSTGQLILGRKTGEAPHISLEDLAAGTYTVKWQVDLKWAGTTDVAIIINPPIPVPKPISYNPHDLQKVEVAKTNNGLTDDHVIWGEINGVMRLIGVVANGAGLTGAFDLSGCTELLVLSCDSNQLTTLDMSGCEKLLGLACDNNQLTALNVSGCPMLGDLYCGGNNLKFSTLPLLGTLFEYQYALQENVEITASLDTKQTLDLSSEYSIGGTETVYTWYYANGTPITGGYSETAGTFVFDGLKDGDAIYCTITNAKFPSLTLKTTEVTIVSIPYNLHDLQKVEAAKTLNGLTDDHIIWGESNGEMRLIGVIANDAGLTGALDLAGCEQLWVLACDNNLLTVLDVSGCTTLLGLTCENNRLTTLDVSGCSMLGDLYCRENNLTFSTLPLRGTLFEYQYASQGNVEIVSAISTTQTLDLSSEYNIGGTPTVYTWYYANGTPITGGYTETAGTFVFDGLKDGDVIYCVMTNEKFSDLTLTTTEVTISNTPAMPYDLDDDGRVDIHDLISFIQDYGKRGDDLVSDFNGDGVVNIQDLILFIQHYGWRADTMMAASTQAETAAAVEMIPPQFAAMFGLVAEPEMYVEEVAADIPQAADVVPVEAAAADEVVYPRSDADHPALTGTPPQEGNYHPALTGTAAEEGNMPVTVVRQFSAAGTTAAACDGTSAVAYEAPTAAYEVPAVLASEPIPVSLPQVGEVRETVSAALVVESMNDIRIAIHQPHPLRVERPLPTAARTLDPHHLYWSDYGTRREAETGIAVFSSSEKTRHREAVEFLFAEEQSESNVETELGELIFHTEARRHGVR